MADADPKISGAAKTDAIVVEDEAAALFRVNRRAFTDPDILARECEHIF